MAQNVRRLIVLLGAALILVGVIALLVPVSVPNGNGGSIGCGNAVASNYSSARSANDNSGANIPIIGEFIPHTDYVAQCQSALSSRRSWSIPVTILGVLVTGGALLASLGTRRQAATAGERPINAP